MVWGIGRSVLLALFASVLYCACRPSEPTESPRAASRLTREKVAEILKEPIQAGKFPNRISIALPEHPEVIVHYTIDEDSQNYMTRLIEAYRPDYAAFVAADAKTGRVLSLVSYTRQKTEIGHLGLRATFPAASIFKIVTATAALDAKLLTPDSEIAFNGGLHTLYRRNVAQFDERRWGHRMTLREAFAKSVNTVFGKVGYHFVKAGSLDDYAHRFQFNQPLLTELPVEAGSVDIEGADQWKLAELASGYNRVALMSPLQGMLMAAAIVNDGVMMEPFIVDQMVSPTGEVLYKGEPKSLSVTMTNKTAQYLKSMMAETVRTGTARKAFRPYLKKSLFQSLSVGGKTGSLTGVYPGGKCDWFVGYGELLGRKIAVAALTVNEDKWRVKASFLASAFLERSLSFKRWRP